MTARNILWPEGVFPEIEGALPLRPLQPLTFAQARDVEHFAGRPLDRLDHIIGPGKPPARFGHRIDPRHALPAAVAVAHSLGVVLMHQLDRGACASLDAGGPR